MAFKNFRVNIILRIIGLIGAMAAFAWFIVRPDRIPAFYLGVLILILIVEFFIYTDRLNRDLNQFFLSIFHDDYTSVYGDRGRGKSFRQIYRTMNEITQKFQSLNREKELRNQYLFSLIDQVKVGILSFEPDGKVNMVNRAFTEMLDTPAIRRGTLLEEQAPELFPVFRNLAYGERQLLRRRIRNQEKEFSIISSGFKIRDKMYRLVSVQDIREELDTRELEAWQKLIRVLTHEIMNSVSPISSLTGSLHDLVAGTGKGAIGIRQKERLREGLEAVRERSAGLMKFTEAYKHLSGIPSPVIADVETRTFVERIAALFRVQFESGKIRFSIHTEKAPKTFRADPGLLEQVIINLVQNAADAVRDKLNAEISITITAGEGERVSILVRDNGSGIPGEHLDRIFVPFFSTKEKGSGIGLSLSRQIILMHRGSITVDSRPGSGSIFEIIL